MAKDPDPYPHGPQDQAGLEALAKSIEEAMADYERNGPASPEEFGRLVDEAIAEGNCEGEAERAALHRVTAMKR